ncbi:MAG: heavy-metal-associated domain-containing protein [Bacteroidetes bacterium]|nr:heavy-metal-associated domain-containing protein [Bacteroidota bacterium]
MDIKTSAQCGSCKSAIEKAVNNVDGVKSAELDLETKIVTVKYDVEKTNVDALKSAIVNIGYDANEVAADAKAYENLHSCCKKE